MRYCIYLRKSRSDTESEESGGPETLARHEKALLELASKQRLNVKKIYRELISAETIAARPMMQKLLADVERGDWAGVLVMEVERLARGDTADQGMVAQTFKYSDTKIITPQKTYDPRNDSDEEYFEFGLFMSRREYKAINRRLQSGRLASVKEGKYVAACPPFGYEKVRIPNSKGFTLRPVLPESEVVKLIYEYYTNGLPLPDGSLTRLGTSLIARKLNELGIKPQKSQLWSASSVRGILGNPVYCGKIRWNWRPAEKRMRNGAIITERPRSDEYIISNGLHPPIISEDIYALAQSFLSSNPPRPLPAGKSVANPLAGIMICGKCGRKMIRRPAGARNKTDIIMCPLPFCANISAPLHLVENRILKSLESWLLHYKLEFTCAKRTNTALSTLERISIKAEKEIACCKKQMDTVHNLLERGVYDISTFSARRAAIEERLGALFYQQKKICCDIERERGRQAYQQTLLCSAGGILESYAKLTSAKEKNDLLKELISKIIYNKDVKGQRQGGADNFHIALYPNIPKGKPGAQ